MAHLQTIVGANDTRQGDAGVLTPKANLQILATTHEVTLDVDTLKLLMDTRLDDPRYYTGDAAT